MEEFSGLFYSAIWLLAATTVYQLMGRAGLDSHKRWTGFFMVLVASIVYKSVEILRAGGEEAEEIIELIYDWNFVNIGIAALIVLVVGTGVLRTRYKGIVWGVSIAVLWAALHVGIGRHEWGEVFFNGTLL